MIVILKNGGYQETLKIQEPVESQRIRRLPDLPSI
jgi:hypothetical protein